MTYDVDARIVTMDGVSDTTSAVIEGVSTEEDTNQQHYANNAINSVSKNFTDKACFVHTDSV